MLVQVFRLFRFGQPINRAEARSNPVEGELKLRLRITGRGDQWDIYLATLEHPSGQYVIPCLDRARILEIERHWIHIRGVEVNPRGQGIKNIRTDNYQQEWWCRAVMLPKAGPVDDDRAMVDPPAVEPERRKLRAPPWRSSRRKVGWEQMFECCLAASMPRSGS